ncbi:alpha/beta fold hydrolase [Paeniglutamicibacter sp. ORCA_105]|uniref:alpha/beta fold hydrolase n=1 Tax=Paeniglutamicibacter sp. ORCA_105 TaxID=3377336 RepID=UPI003896317E
MESDVRKLSLATGIEVPCFVHGNVDARPLMLLHAWGESRRSFDRLVPRLAGFRVLAPDLRGHGDAEKPGDGYSLAEQAADAAAILDALDVPAAFVLGSSSGGYVAQQLAVDHRQRVQALVLAGAPLTLRGRPAFADSVEALTDPVSVAWVRESLSLFPLQHAVPEWYLQDRGLDGAAVPADIWRASLEGLCEATPPTESGTIDAPALILWGGRDPVLSRTDEETLCQRIAGSFLKIYPEAGHLVLWERPAQVAADTTAFLGSLG